MSKVDVHKVESTDDRSLPVFSEFDDLMDRIRIRAYNLFRDRGSNLGRDLDDWLTAEREVCWPAAELEEEDDEFEIKIALAGFEPDEISLTATPRELIVKAAHESKRESDETSDARWSEFRSNEVYRRVELPADIDVDRIETSFRNGMLEIEAPKAVTKRKQKRQRRKKASRSRAS